MTLYSPSTIKQIISWSVISKYVTHKIREREIDFKVLAYVGAGKSEICRADWRHGN